MILALILVPAAAGLIAFFLRPVRLRRWLILVTAMAHASLTALAWVFRPPPSGQGLLGLDDLGLLFLGVTSVLFLAVAVYTLGYLAREGSGEHQDFEEGLLFANAPEAVFSGCLLCFLAAMTLVTVSQHFGLIWIGVEATTLVSAPLIYFHRQHRSLEATWKYLMVCSVGIGLALLGSFFLAVAAVTPAGVSIPLAVGDLVAHAGALQVPWLKLAFVLLLVGYGTKMGLAPLHTWLPDAHSESPSVVSALTSGALLNCAFLAILRAYQVCAAAGLLEFGQRLVVALGLLSMGLACVFLLGQADYKRMLAYSSVEHMGVLALGVGLGGGAGFGAMLHVVNHSLAKGMLFLVAGNILAVYRTKSSAQVTGVLRSIPVSGVLWMVGLFAITGSPPFGLFLSEFTILRAAMNQGHWLLAAAFVVLLASAFVAMAGVMIRMAHGPRPDIPRVSSTETALAIAPPIALGALVLMLGVYVPAPLSDLLRGAAGQLGGR